MLSYCVDENEIEKQKWERRMPKFVSKRNLIRVDAGLCEVFEEMKMILIFVGTLCSVLPKPKKVSPLTGVVMVEAAESFGRYIWMAKTMDLPIAT